MTDRTFRRGVLLLLGLAYALSGSLLFGETILVSSSYPEGKDLGKEQVLWCESGAMEYLFGEGHIVFSTAPNETTHHDSFEAVSLRIAKNSGARYLLELNMRFSTSAPDKNDPKEAMYRFLDVSTEKELSSGKVPFEPVEGEGAEKQTERLMQAGMEIALRVAEGL